MWSNLKFFEDNNCGDVFFVLNDYLENLLLIHNNLRAEINNQKDKVSHINTLLNAGVKVPMDDLIISNDYSNALLRHYKIVKYKILEVNGVMNKNISEYKKSALKFFKRVLAFYVEKEEYAHCKTLQNVLDLIS